MLVLNRKQRETIVIDGNVEVEILRTGKSSVRLGIRAPRQVTIRRGELTPKDEDLASLKTSSIGSDSTVSERTVSESMGRHPVVAHTSVEFTASSEETSGSSTIELAPLS